MKHIILTGAVALLSVLNTYGQEAELSPNVTARGEQLLQQNVADYKSDVEYKLPWDKVMERDVLWNKMVWRVIDANVAGNELFKPQQNVGTPLMAAVLKGVATGKIKAYDAVDDRFTKELTTDEVKAFLKATYQQPDQVLISRYKIKEQWLFTNEGKMQVRVVGIAPLKGNSDDALFWVYFPGSREYLSGFMADGKDNWDVVIDQRYFKSEIVKTGETHKSKNWK